METILDGCETNGSFIGYSKGWVKYQQTFLSIAASIVKRRVPFYVDELHGAEMRPSTLTEEVLAAKPLDL